MFDPSLALELAYTAVEEAVRMNASFADVRYEALWEEEVGVSRGRLEVADAATERGLGVRVLVGGAWGFSAISEPTRHDVRVAVRRAVELARAAAIVQDSPVELSEQVPQRGVYRTPVSRDPMGVPLDDKIHLLAGIDDRLRAHESIVTSKARFHAQRRRKVYVSSEGAEIEQDLVYTGIGFRVGASDGERFQVRSFTGGGGIVLGRGWEMMRELGLEDRADEVASEALELLHADRCPEEAMDVILGGPQMAEHVARGLGPLFELERMLGFGGGGYSGTILEPRDLGVRRLASSHVHLSSDARQRGGAGTFGFDDEGVSAERIELLSEGRVAGYLASREMAAKVGLDRSRGSMRASSWSAPPTPRASNLILQPGKNGDLEALIAGTDRGVLIDGPSNLSFDARGRTFVAACESAWLIEGGKRVRRLRNPSYRGSTEAFWGACDGVADESVWGLYGRVVVDPWTRRPVPVGVGTSPARFGRVSVGSGPPQLIAAPSDEALPLLPVDGERAPGFARTFGPGRPRVSPVKRKRIPRSDVK